MSKAIAIDFDGVIHRYGNGYSGPMDIPNYKAFQSMKKLHDQGYRIVIFSCRPKDQIERWMTLHYKMEMGDELWKKWEITNVKPIDAIAFVDDRAIRFTHWDDITKYFL